jgi:hypothetical protein
MSAVWADFVDARRRLVHEWREQGNTPAHIARRLVVAPELVEVILRQAIDPPQPGSVRAQRDEWKRRALAAENALHLVPSTAPPVPPPTLSELRALALDPHPAACGCQYWVDTPPESAGDQHNPHCEHAPKPA